MIHVCDSLSLNNELVIRKFCRRDVLPFVCSLYLSPQIGHMNACARVSCLISTPRILFCQPPRYQHTHHKERILTLVNKTNGFEGLSNEEWEKQQSRPAPFAEVCGDMIIFSIPSEYVVPSAYANVLKITTVYFDVFHDIFIRPLLFLVVRNITMT